MNANAFTALLTWQLHQRWRGASALIMPAVLALLLPSVGAFVMLPMLVTAGLMMPGLSTEFVFPVSPRAVALSRLLAASLLRVLPFVIVATLVIVRQPSGARPMLSFDVLLAIGTTAALFPELVAFWGARLGPTTRATISLIVPLFTAALLVLSGLTLRAVAVSLVAVTMLGVLYLMARPGRLMLACGAASKSAGEVARSTGARGLPLGDAPRVGAGLGARDLASLLFGQFGWQWVGYLAPALMLTVLPISSQLMALGLISGVVSLPAASSWWLDMYPVSRRFKLVLMCVIPLGLTLATGVGQAVPTPLNTSLSLGAPQSKVDGRTFYGDPTLIPLTYWQSAASPQVRIVSSWGEQVDAHTVTIGRWHLFNPFSVRPESSPRFVNWQRDRMTFAVYGRVVSKADLRAGRVPLRRTQSWSMLIMQGGLFLSWALLVLSIGLVPHQPTRVSGWLMASPAFLPLGAWMWELSRGFDSGAVVLPLLQRALLSLEAALPSRLLALPLALVPVTLTMALLYWRLSRREAGSVMYSALRIQMALRGTV